MSDFDIFHSVFPENSLGITRGSVLQSNHDIPHLGISKHERFPVGFDGSYVRCTGLTWSIEQLVEEVQAGVWTITGEVLDLTNEKVALIFAMTIEQRSVGVVEAARRIVSETD